METFSIRSDKECDIIVFDEDLEKINDENEEYLRILAFLSSLFIFFFPLKVIGYSYLNIKQQFETIFDIVKESV